MSASSPAQVLALYRAILRAAQRFPSIKKQAIIADIKQQFREHRALEDPARVAHELRVAQRSLEELRQYAGLGGRGAGEELEVSLKGSCD